MSNESLKNKNYYDKFRKTLSERALLTDGAMGTEIYNKGIFINKCYESLNLDVDKKGIIKSIHESYINAGADINISNTYGANRIRLSLHGLADKVDEINTAGIKILTDLRDNNPDKFFFIGGSVGSTGTFSGNITKVDKKEVYEAYFEQIKTLIEAGVDLISFESHNSLPELEIAIKATRDLSSEIPILAMMTFPQKNETIFGLTVKTVAKKLSTLEVDVIGVNCSTGPQRALDLLKEFIANTDKKTIVMPNAGYPQRIDGRMLYMSNTELFGTYATKFLENGAAIIGGCCGTTPEFISQMYKSLRQQYPSLNTHQMQDKKIVKTQEEVESLDPVEIGDRSVLGKLLFSKEKKERRKVLSMEILPPKSPAISKTIEIVNSFEDNFDLVNIPDGPRASSRMAISTTSYLIEKNSSNNIETITHYCCRDRNILGIQSDLLAMHALGLRNILAITGDPPKLGDYPNITAVFDVDAIGLVKIIADLNKGLDIVGNFIGEQTSFLIGVGANPTADNIEREVLRLEEKIKVGAEYIMTQPVYEIKQFLDFYEKIKHLNKPIIIGISPLTSYKSAHFQHNEIPGMQIPEDLLEKLRLSKDKKEAREIGVGVAIELLDEVFDKISGVYFMAQGKIGRRLSSEIISRSKLKNVKKH